ncbi:MAG: hypothetical protein ACC628_22905 [Pirellulaceae bacterium]
MHDFADRFLEMVLAGLGKRTKTAHQRSGTVPIFAEALRSENGTVPFTAASGISPNSVCLFHSLALFLCGAAFASEPTASLAEAEAEILASVRSLSADVLEAEPKSLRERKLMQGYYDSIHQWGSILAGRIQPIPGHPDWGYYGRRGHREDDVRPITYAAMVNAFLSEVPSPGDAPDKTARAHFRGDAIAALRYLAQAHVTGGGACLDGKPWGNQWQSAMWTRAAGMAGWLLWPHLDDEMKRSIVRLIEFEANRFLSTRSKSSEFGDTGAEENAWNSTLLALAANMMPAHPRAKQWDEAARRYMYNCLSVAADQNDDTLGDLDRPIRRWVTTVNAHPDFTVENHGLVHVGYLKATVAMLMESAGHYMATNSPVPRACLHHVPDAFEVLLACSAWDGSPVYFAGNDWKICHSQATDVVIYAVMGILADDRRAAFLEETALDWLRQIQRAESGYYNVRRDLEYGGLCATRLITCYVTHAASDEAASPMDELEFDRRQNGVKYLPDAKAILQRTPTKFASFTWGPKRMALALPKNGNWVVWPHFASYLGRINGREPSQRDADMAKLNHRIGSDRFAVTGTLRRIDGHVAHDFSFASLPNDMTVYVERLTSEKDFRIVSRQTGIIGHEYDIGTNERTLYGRFGARRLVGVGGEAKVHEWHTDWLNLGDRVGYVVCRAEGHDNIVRYHDLTKGSGRVPKLQEWFSLIGDRGPVALADWACVVTFLNQPAAETAEWVRRVDFRVDGHAATCRVGDYSVNIDFKDTVTRIEQVGQRPASQRTGAK